LLDVGIYPLSLASMVLGVPAEIKGLAHIGPEGVDEQAAITLGYSGGRLALLHTSICANTFHEASLIGATGRIKLHPGWWRGSPITLFPANGNEQSWEFPLTGSGYQFEAAAFMDCLRQNRPECDVMPLDETLSIMRTMDALRAQWGLKYPME
jgi:predicted dehydrogenase